MARKETQKQREARRWWRNLSLEERASVVFWTTVLRAVRVREYARLEEAYRTIYRPTASR